MQQTRSALAYSVFALKQDEIQFVMKRISSNVHLGSLNSGEQTNLVISTRYLVDIFFLLYILALH